MSLLDLLESPRVEGATRGERLVATAVTLGLSDPYDIGHLTDSDEPGRFLLVERYSWSAQNVKSPHAPYLSTHDSPTEASNYHADQERREDWDPVALVDLDGGDVHTVKVRLEFDPPVAPTILHPPPFPERVEDRPCASCGEVIEPGQAYVVRGPFHIGCAPRSDG